MFSKNLRIFQLTSHDGEKDPLRPCVFAFLGEQRIKQYALIDSGADMNTLSHETYESLQDPPPLTPTNICRR